MVCLHQDSGGRHAGAMLKAFANVSLGWLALLQQTDSNLIMQD